MLKKTKDGGAAAPVSDLELVPDTEHPDFQDGRYDDLSDFTPHPDAPPLPPFPPQPLPFEPRLPLNPRPLPERYPFPPLNICTSVSGRYRQVAPAPVFGPALPRPAPGPIVPGPALPIRPLNLTSMTVRVDVDRYFPQNRISVEVSRLFPSRRCHVIAEVTSDQCTGFNRRRVEATITYRDGDATLFPGTLLVFEARRTTGRGYGAYSLTVSGGGAATRTHALAYESQYFDPVEFEVDCVSNAGAAVTTMATGAHPTRPADLPAETISLATVYKRAGFDVTMSAGGNVIPVSGSGANGTWSDAEMHNAMVTHWSRFANSPRWAMWVLFAARHDQGRTLGGVMFDDIGPNHRQGTAIFTDSFIQDVPAGDPNPAAWRQRMVFWTAIHEMGHAFNLAHSWQKALGTPQAPGDPWIPLANEPEARSFMNYPFRVAGGQASFFADFRFRFSDSELQFMRHAPRRFVQMGNANWFVNHGFEAPSAHEQSGAWTLKLRPNRESNRFAFLEPVKLELKLTNSGGQPVMVEPDMLTDGKHISLLVAKKGAPARLWAPFMTQCHESHWKALAPGESLYGEQFVGATTSGWLIDEPGLYTVQAAVDMGSEVVVSNVLEIIVGTPESVAEEKLAPDWFTEDVARVLAFQGAPALEKATDTVRAVAEQAAGTPAAIHAAVALSSPLLRDFKVLADGEEPKLVAKAADVGKAAAIQSKALLDAPDTAAQTMGHIDYFATLGTLAEALADNEDRKAASDVLASSVKTMKDRGVLESVIARTQKALDRLRKA